MPSPESEPILAVIADSIDRIIEAAYLTVSEDRLNFFGQKRIATFLPRQTGYSASLVYKLQEGTYRAYKRVWKRLIAFIHRTNTPERPTQIRHRLTPRQTAPYDSLVTQAALCKASSSNHLKALDEVTLDFCVSLLDDRLPGDLFESPIVSFLAVLGVDETNGTFYEASAYTSKLSAFIKIAQLFVLQKAVLLAEAGLAQDAIEALDEMCERFLSLDECTPFAWAVSLRSFGKRIRDSTTTMIRDFDPKVMAFHTKSVCAA